MSLPPDVPHGYAYREGEQAFIAGEEVNSNPHPLESEAYLEWVRGWSNAMLHLNPSYNAVANRRNGWVVVVLGIALLFACWAVFYLWNHLSPL